MKSYYGLLLIMILPIALHAQITFDVETGLAISGYNDVQIPNKTGTEFSLSEALEAENSIFYRIRLRYPINRKHILSVLYAPLLIHSEGSLDRDIRFKNTVFEAGTPLEADYVFNSYRLTYRYEWVKRPRVDFGIGLTAKIRDAEIRLENETTTETKTNFGFVPLIHFRLHWRPVERFGFLLEGDALGASQGRAEDVLAALTFRAEEELSLKLGYRILEGGADVDEVYNFALVHYAVIGAWLHF